MKQLMWLYLSGTLCVHRLGMRCGLGRLRAVLWRTVRFASGEPRGGGACSQFDRSSWGSVAGTEPHKDGAADVA